VKRSAFERRAARFLRQAVLCHTNAGPLSGATFALLTSKSDALVPHPTDDWQRPAGAETTDGDGSYLADQLARNGIASLVYDKRGTGKSTGDWRSGGFESGSRRIAPASFVRARVAGWRRSRCDEALRSGFS
jgi:alpha/beta superfamily hydrolase